MSESNTYKTIINEKFSDFSFQDMDTTWLDMKDILDREMPHNKRRRSLLWLNWYSGSALFLLGLAVIALTIFGYQHSNENLVLENKMDQLPSNKDEQNISGSASTEVGNEIQTNTIQKTESVATRRTSTNRQVRNSASEKITNRSNNNQSTNNSVVLFKTTTVKSTVNKSDNTIGLYKVQKQDTKVSRSIITAGHKTTQKTVLVNKDADHTDDVVVTSEIQKYSKRLPVVKAESIKISNQHLMYPGLVNKGELSHLIPAIASVSSNDSALVSDSKNPNKKAGKGWVVGASINYILPVSNQEMSTINMNGKQSTLIDFLPSVYVQYHLDNKWHLESSFQFSSPQYISNHKVAAFYKDLNPNKKEENAIWLNKLYYLNLPLSVHYKVMPNMTIGSGIQYSYLRRSIFADEIAIWEKQGSGWSKTASQKSIAVKSNAAVKKEKSNNGNVNGNGGGNTTPPSVPLNRVDTVAQTLQSSDLRLLFDVNYSLKRLNMGIRFNLGMNNYINNTSGSNVLPVKDKNQALQLYMRYDIFDKRKKK